MTTRTLILPDLGEVTEIEVTEILVEKGQNIMVGEPMMIIESDKATIEVPADQSGIVADILVSVGEQLQPSANLLTLIDSQSPAGQVELAARSPSQAAESTAPAEVITVDSETVAKQTDQSEKQVSQSISKWKTSIKSSPSARDLAETLGVDISQVTGTGKRSTVIPQDVQAFYETSIKSAAASSTTPVNEPTATASTASSVVATAETGESAAASSTTPANEPTVTASTASSVVATAELSESAAASSTTPANEPTATASTASSAVATAELSESAAVPSTVSANEPKPAENRVSLPDLPIFMQPQPVHNSGQEAKAESRNNQSVTIASAKPNKVASYKGEGTSLTKQQKIVAGRMSDSWQNIPHVTQNHTVDMTDLNQTIQNYRKQGHASGIKITVLAFVVKAIALTLEQEKMFRSMYDDVGNTLVLTDTYDIGIAVDTHPGLVVPVIRDCLHKDIMDIAQEITQLSDKARNRKLLPSQMQGGVFTISSLGPAITGHFSPIIFPPQVAIMGVSAMFEKFDLSLQRRGAITPHLPLSLSYDHRVVNGADAVRFLVAFEKFLTAI